MTNKKPVIINYIGDNSYISALSELKEQLNFAFGQDGNALKAVLIKEKVIDVQVETDGASIFTYYDRASFFRGFSLALQYGQKGKKKSICVKPLMSRLGTMQNCSAAVMKLTVLKELIRQSALTGYNYMQIYLETTYEVDNEPYFGYKKGRYSKKELKELAAYGEMFGVELIPCIQTLGHLSQLFKWDEYAQIHDIRDTVLVNHERTYVLIDNMLKSLCECFKTNRINLGMDEAYFMGLGRYNWFVDDSKPDISMLFISHLKKVLQLAEKYGYDKPEIWFDNLFEINYKGYIDPPEWLFKDFSKEITQAMPKVKLVYWNYCIRELNNFDRLISYVRQLSQNVSFASMAHGYTSFAPENGVTARLVETAVKGCIKNGIDDIMVTWWGSMISPLALLPSFYDYAERSSKSEGVDFEERCKFLFGYTYTEFCMLDIPNKTGGANAEVKMAEGNNAPFYMLANDPLLGILDAHTPFGIEKEFLSCAQRMQKLAKRSSPYSYIFKFEAVMCKTLAVKAELSKKIKAAYKAKDSAALERIKDSIPRIIKQIEKFHREYYVYFHTFNKSIGWEVMDARLGGLIMRLKTVKEILGGYLDGKTDRIEPLEEDSLPIAAQKDGQIISYRDWNGASSSN